MTETTDTAPDRSCGDLDHLLAGAATFEREVFPRQRGMFEALARGQAPSTLFITCADSRISPGMITQTGPGELFAMRNIGNIVPAYGEMLGGVSAVIEYAVAALEVRHIIVCGHTDCGAMKALQDPDASGIETMPTVKSWLHNATAARRVADALSAGMADPGDRMRVLIEQNVRLQLTHLRTHPSVAAALAQGRLELHGWVYGIAEGRISVIDEAGGTISVETARARLAGRDPAAAPAA